MIITSAAIDGDIALCGANVWLPETVERTADAIARGRIDAGSAAEIGVDAVHVADGDLTPPDMAAAAALAALAAAGRPASTVGLLLHCHVWHQGYDIWCAPHYVAERIGADGCLPITLSQGCNAAMAAFELAIPWLTAHDDGRTVLVSAADRFPQPGFDRWRGAYGCVYGDGAAAAVLARGPVPGALAIRALASTARPELEEVNRAGLAATTAPRMHGADIDLRRPKKEYFQRHGMARFLEVTQAALRSVVEQSLAQAGVAADDPRIRGIAVPRISTAAIGTSYAPLLGSITAAPVLSMHRDTGHLSCADVVANVADLRSQVLHQPGDLGIVVNVGGGYTWSSLIVEATDW
ncbi:ketoacyl-ACP synthase III family protein [Catellatospora tritici]|uniref:ketoacyl-ACP synthase III family protein n=1 Tax=Catellatospora tritici TaxID=2851566 RepID=UPI001C2D2ABA|nr:ketoacyl-ACP synthase III family protein [Catellatospora tritici]MBV1849576.1 ketoacyl-ACP synthase III family protein [Catellatospora tritici]